LTSASGQGGLTSFIHLLTTLLFGVATLTASGQSSTNLVPNSSFEAHANCPEKAGQIRTLYKWKADPSFPVDYYHACANESFGVPRNQFGYQHAPRGKGYIGITVEKRPSGQRSFAHIELDQTLRQYQLYRISFKVSLAEASGMASDGLGIYLSRQSPTKFRDHVPQIYLSEEQFLTDTAQWMEVSQQFLAQGGERYLILGNFYPPDLTNFQLVRPDADTFSYYYIDDVAVEPLHRGINDLDTLNQVLNGGFEYYHRCPGKSQQIAFTPFWNQHTFFERYHHGRPTSTTTATVPK
jgi:hypothetical protein